jgi:hypothetical protein
MKWFRLPLVLLSCLVMTGATATVVAATTSPALAATCSGNGCNGTDPQATGCSANAITLSSARMITIRSGGDVGSIEMRYSRTCRTQWIRVTSRITDCSGDPCTNMARIRRPAGADGGAISYQDNGRPGSGQVSQWSRQVYTPSTRSCGTGAIDTGNDTGVPNRVNGAEICG